MRLSAFDLANHWPYVRRHLRLARTPTLLRVLDVLAAEQVEHMGDPVPMRRALLERPWGPPGRQRTATAGQAGNAWRALKALQGRGVVEAWDGGGGRRADLWRFRSDVRQWDDMPWSGWRERVASNLEACTCRAKIPVVARIPGQGVALSRERPGILLDPEDHLDFCAPDARQTRDAARLVADDLGIRRQIARQEPPLYLSPLGRRTPSSSLGGTDDEALRTLKEAVEASTGGVLFGQPLEELAMVAGRCNGELGALAQRLREDGERTRSPVQVARRAGEHLRLLQAEAHEKRRADEERLRRRYELLSRLEELDEDQAAELAHLGSILGASA